MVQNVISLWCRLFGLRGTGSVVASQHPWPLGRGPTHSPPFQLFHFEVLQGSVVLCYVFASCWWLHMFRAVVSGCVYVGSEKQVKML